MKNLKEKINEYYTDCIDFVKNIFKPFTSFGKILISPFCVLAIICAFIWLGICIVFATIIFAIFKPEEMPNHKVKELSFCQSFFK